ncbi:MAG: AhpC/TSA family protein [Flavobacteriales bacterium]|nr:AhpC/TSA family protein [Flavobacteriales bacterium]
MKKILFITAFLVLSISCQAQKEINVKISGMIFNSPVDTFYVSQFFGNYYKDYHKITPDKKGNFAFVGKLPAMDYYILRVGNSNVQLILRDNSDLKVYGDGKKLKEFCNISGSDESKAMNDFATIIENWSIKSDSAMNALKADPTREQNINQYMQGEYTIFQGAMQDFVTNNQNSPALIMALSQINAEADFKTYEALMTQINSTFEESPTVKAYYENYRQLKKKIESGKLLAEGKLAPDFEEFLTDGKKQMKLSDLKGKVVLIDFWASWCGPCRKENPNVVKTYEKYKADGFTIMSVSLDTDREKWLAAIKQDNLTWPNHVSDLKGWSSKVGRMYEVGSVPFTVLIDREGRIIKVNLRGEALEKELSKIFGH